MAVGGWIVDKSAAARVGDPLVAAQLEELAGLLHVCELGVLEQLYSARSAVDYDLRATAIYRAYRVVTAPADLLDRALRLQRSLAHHHGMWHRIPIPDLLIAEIAIHHELGILHVDGDFERIAEVRPIRVRRLSTQLQRS